MILLTREEFEEGQHIELKGKKYIVLSVSSHVVTYQYKLKEVVDANE